ncbi:MAG: ATP-grasp domain-containing protein [Alphaproteobacteria bacterium GM202ARS2]|nr:ATP-grasp domain-containing protein [Alphaproteobacteria bacterium GM202ARS2]
MKLFSTAPLAKKAEHTLKRLLILSDEPLATHEHASSLKSAAEKKGVRVHVKPYHACTLKSHMKGYGGGQSAITVEDSDEPYHAVLARSIAHGSLEELTFKLSLLHSFEQAGVAVINSPSSIEATIDKGRCMHMLRYHQLPIPHTWTTCCEQQAVALVRAHSTAEHPLVFKPLFGAQGKGITLVSKPTDLPSKQQAGGVWHLQKFIPCTNEQGQFQNWRVLVIGNKAHATMCRVSSSWINNASLQATCALVHEPALEALAVDVARCLQLAYGGIDIIRDAHGHPMILEANSVPAWRALENSGAEKVAPALIDFVLGGKTP